MLSGAHLTLFSRVLALLQENGRGDVLVFGGGIIPGDDLTTLEAAGVARVFTPGAPLGEITEWLERALDARESRVAH